MRSCRPLGQKASEDWFPLQVVTAVAIAWRRKLKNGSQLDVVHESEKKRFAVYTEGKTAVLKYRLAEDEVVFTHTGVPPALEGRGIGSRLVRAGLDWARAEGVRVVPMCSFVTRYIERHPEYADLRQR